MDLKLDLVHRHREVDILVNDMGSLSRSRPRTSRTQRIVRGRSNSRLRRLGIRRDMRRGLGRRTDDRSAKLLGGRPAIVARPAVLEQVAA
jgi:hypothetical protein